jgi:hypothetical protein
VDAAAVADEQVLRRVATQRPWRGQPEHRMQAGRAAAAAE